MKKYKEFCDKINEFISNNELNKLEKFFSDNDEVFQILAILCFQFSVILVPFSIAYRICIYFLIPCFACAVFFFVMVSYAGKKFTTLEEGVIDIFNEYYGDYEDEYIKEKFSKILLNLENDIKKEITTNSKKIEIEIKLTHEAKPSMCRIRYDLKKYYNMCEEFIRKFIPSYDRFGRLSIVNVFKDIVDEEFEKIVINESTTNGKPKLKTLKAFSMKPSYFSEYDCIGYGGYSKDKEEYIKNNFKESLVKIVFNSLQRDELGNCIEDLPENVTEVFKKYINSWSKDASVKKYSVFYIYSLENYYSFIDEKLLKNMIHKNNYAIELKNIKHVAYENHCWNCGAAISSESDQRCGECGWYICKRCGACEVRRGIHKH